MSKFKKGKLNLSQKELEAYENMLKGMEKKIAKEYQQAHKEVAKKAEDYFKRFEKKDSAWKEWVDSGKKTKEEYVKWRTGQMAMGNRWNDMRDVIATDLANSDKIAASIMNDYIPEAYALGHNWGTYEVETDAKINTSYTLYNRESVEKLIKEDPDLLPKARVSIPKDKVWNRQHLDSAITQGILQGESIPAIAKRLENVTDMNHRAAIRNARTMTGSAENAGHMNAYKRAQDMGIELEKQWVATFDNRTRTSHRYLHGETQEIDEPFSNGLMYPKDPSGPSEEVYNCRCRLISNVVGFSRDLKGIYDNSRTGMSYEEWLEATPISQSITHGEEIANAQRMQYTNEYEQKATSNIVDGKDISEEWQRRADQFDFEINDVIDAQGFDGNPRVVDADEFERAVEDSNFIAQRAYSAPDQETLKAYREQLYNGEWFVDCSVNGAAYGQGMYASADYDGVISEATRKSMEFYTNLNASQGSGETYIETFTMTPDARFVEYGKLQSEFEQYRREIQGKINQERHALSEEAEDSLVAKIVAENPSLSAFGDSAVYFIKAQSGMIEADWDKTSEAASRLGSDGRKAASQAMSEINRRKSEYVKNYVEANRRTSEIQDIGAYAASRGYDAIRVDRGVAGSKEVVVLNRTKVIFRRP